MTEFIKNVVTGALWLIAATFLFICVTHHEKVLDIFAPVLSIFLVVMGCYFLGYFIRHRDDY